MMQSLTMRLCCTTCKPPLCKDLQLFLLQAPRACLLSRRKQELNILGQPKAGESCSKLMALCIMFRQHFLQDSPCNTLMASPASHLVITHISHVRIGIGVWMTLQWSHSRAGCHPHAERRFGSGRLEDFPIWRVSHPCVLITVP